MKINLSNYEIEVLLDLSSSITGIEAKSPQIKNYVIKNVLERMTETQHFDFKNYLNLIDKSDEEFKNFLSAVTIHTTGWFREDKHFTLLAQEIKNQYEKNNLRFVNILSVPCSTGQEVYSLAFVLKSLCNELLGLNFAINGFDIDYHSIKKCQNAVYSKTELANIPLEYRKYILNGRDEAKNFFAISREIREHCTFYNVDIRNINSYKDIIKIKNSEIENDSFNIILCRNLFIYFKPEVSNKISKNLYSLLKNNGYLCLGHSEKIEAQKHNLIHIGNSIYQKLLQDNLNISKNDDDIILYTLVDQNRIKPFIERVKKELKTFKIIESISNLKEFLENRKPKIIIIDKEYKTIELIHFLFNYLKTNKNVFIIESILYPLQKEIKNIDIFHESQIFKDFIDWRNFENQTSQTILYLKRILSSNESINPENNNKENKVIKHKEIKKKLENLLPNFIAIGASTGGTIALAELLKNMPPNFPPILIVQHLPHIFSKDFIEKIKKVSGLKFISPSERPLLKPGYIYMADGDNHIIVKGKEGQLRIEPDMSPPKNQLRPCIDFLFESLAKTKAKGVGILLTGMGNDGAHGLLKLIQNGSVTFTQNKESCVIYGMPKEAEALGASCFSGDLHEIRELLLNHIKVK
ncbi:chemotaxis protein CheB [Silvanigrella aquatica]|uniref:protein-glutamate methylesterase n=1 Tax=Silvanigrella aquatica TaxID=1915309 RepID=A0A1L4CYY5_9BACT|nr:chemotaxis protein CheB [Silvanigrella aquatica]APJ03158.1 hypothetical protein AXG55_04260 [Silvanigrella aquatica]